ncbi:MAG: Rne/Rng family ribonuclease [Deltaproteobacteria bacterium]|nr:Rne/Rng family ribonuclease [Deltaproteobacteria bacterium]
MGSLLLISVSPWDTRVALVEQGRLAELYLERRKSPQVTANIYKGKVTRVVPGMDAAFVDIGLERPGYLSAEEVWEGWDPFYNLWLQEDEVLGPAEVPSGSETHAPVGDLLREGQEVLVQVSRAPSAHKGARLTTRITLPGYYLVYAPTLSHLGVSRRISDAAERQRLQGLLEDLKPPEGGLIARTASLGQSEAVLRRERDELVSLWQAIHQRYEAAASPALLLTELDFPRRLIRELGSPDLDRVIVDDPPTYKRVLEYISGHIPVLKNRVELYTEPEPLFLHFGLDLDWRRLLSHQIWLKSGGYLLIEETEALTAIDVNTGKFIGRHQLEDTILQTNLEAAREVARQLRLRNIGGLIVIDFIDMKKPAHREVVYQALLEALKADRAKTSALPISSLGLLEMTRERLGESLAERIAEPCSSCGGRGWHVGPLTIAHDILRQLAADVREFPGCRFKVHAAPQVNALVVSEWEALQGLAQEHHCDLETVDEPGLAPERYHIIREMKL